MIFDTRFSEKEAMQYGVVDGNATIIKYEGDDMRVVIPASIDGFKVTKIEPYAFSEKSMKYIQFPDTLEVIGFSGFLEVHRQLCFLQLLGIGAGASDSTYPFHWFWGF